jgi:hypothetical protein
MWAERRVGFVDRDGELRVLKKPRITHVACPPDA